VSDRVMPPWASLAYLLWRRGLNDWRSIAEHLASEGWFVTPSEVSRVVLARVAEELNQSVSGRRMGGR
jgi:hypothetical protein